jgi:hypothetical protein
MYTLSSPPHKAPPKMGAKTNQLIIKQETNEKGARLNYVCATDPPKKQPQDDGGTYITGNASPLRKKKKQQQQKKRDHDD